MKETLLLVALSAALLLPAIDRALGEDDVADPPEYVVRTAGMIGSPQLFADVAGGLHLFYVDHTRESPPIDRAELMYSRWADGAWSAPVAILGGRGGMSVSYVRAALDTDGVIHLIVMAGDSALWSLAAHVSRAAQPEAWTWAEPITHLRVRSFDLAIAPEGTLHVVAAANDGRVLHWSSTDAGASWSDSTIVRSAPEKEAPDRARLAVGPGGQVYVTWTQYLLPRGWPSTGVYFSASEDGGSSWSAPLCLGGQGVLDGVVGLTPDGIVHVFARDSAGCALAHAQHSGDHGRTWQSDELPAKRFCSVGAESDSLLIDGSGRLLLTSEILSGRQRALSFGLSAWEGGAWSPMSVLVSGLLPSPRGGVNAAAIRLGNDLHFVLSIEGRGLVHGRYELSVPSTLPRPLPVPQSQFANLSARRLSAGLWVLIALLVALLLSLRRAGCAKRRDVWDSIAKLLNLLAAVAVFAMARLPGGVWIEIPLWLVLLAVVELYPPTLLTALIVAGMVAARTFPTGTHTEVPLTLALLGLGGVFWLVRSVRMRRMPELRDPIALLIVALCAIATLSFCVANAAGVSAVAMAPLRAQIGALAVFWACGVALLVAMRWAARPRVLPRLTWTFLCMVGVYVAARTVPELRVLSPAFHPRVWGSVACVWAVALAFGQGGWNRELGGAWRLALLVLVAAILVDAIGPNRAWLAGWVPALAGVGAIALRAVWPRPLFGWLQSLRARPLHAGVMVLAGVAVLLWQRDRLVGFVAIGDNPYSLATRIDAARIMFRIAALRPLLGSGPANYYPLTAAYAIRGNAVTFSSHNNYLDILAQTGAVGLLLFLAVYALALRRAWRLASTASPGFPRAFALGALGGLTGTLVTAALGDWVIPFVYNQTLMQLRSSTFAWLFLGCLLALAPQRAAEERSRNG